MSNKFTLSQWSVDCRSGNDAALFNFGPLQNAATRQQEKNADAADILNQINHRSCPGSFVPRCVGHRKFRGTSIDGNIALNTSGTHSVHFVRFYRAPLIFQQSPANHPTDGTDSSTKDSAMRRQNPGHHRH